MRQSATRKSSSGLVSRLRLRRFVVDDLAEAALKPVKRGAVMARGLWSGDGKRCLQRVGCPAPIDHDAVAETPRAFGVRVQSNGWDEAKVLLFRAGGRQAATSSKSSGR